MLRQELSESLKRCVKASDKRSVETIRLILAALKDRDTATRGDDGALSEQNILQLLHTMIRQRRESIALYESGGRVDLATRETEEIAVIERFLPAQIEGDELVTAVRGIINELDAQTIKDMGRTMASLKERYAGRMNFSDASCVVREILV